MTTEEHILNAAFAILERDGLSGVTTRAVCQAANITAPTLYHHFGDKNGLIQAVVSQGVSAFIAQKRGNHQTQDAVDDLRRGWNGWIAFAVERPNLFRLMIESTRSHESAKQEAFQLMQAIIFRLEVGHRLTVDAATAARTVWAASNGILSLFLQGASASEISASSDLMFEALIKRLVRSA